MTFGTIFAQEIQPAIYHPAQGVEIVKVVRHRRVYRRRAYRNYRNPRRVVVYNRSHRKSAAIIGGSAAGGAAIGALAGGGKGAAIGALVGGGGGLAYDRATHKKTVVVR